MYQFRDPVHGFIDVLDGELKIINSAPFQRLRYIRQLATTYLVYHGAEHTRFGHSIGVMHLTSKVFDSVTKKNPFIFSNNKEENDVLCAWYRQILRLIGLTHDMGHAPFSHASEELFEDGKKHEDYTKHILFDTEVADYVNLIGRNFKKIYGESYDITPDLIWMIYEGKDVTNEKFRMPDFMFLRSFMDGELDCDKMDYLLRDSLYCGVTYGKYDLNRFVSTLTAYRHDNRLQLAIERGGVQALEEFVLARYFMFIQVYFHKTRRYLDKLLVKCLRKILPSGKYPTDISEYLKWDDNRVLEIFAESNDSTICDFKDRRIMSCVYESKPHSEKADQLNAAIIRKALEKEFKEKIEYDSVDKEAHKLTPVLLAHNDDSGKEIMIYDPQSKMTENIMEESMILNSILKSISIQRIYAKKDVSREVIERIKELRTL